MANLESLTESESRNWGIASSWKSMGKFLLTGPISARREEFLIKVVKSVFVRCDTPSRPVTVVSKYSV
jgi:hypothetical protein